jgi:hypothetical protein
LDWVVRVDQIRANNQLLIARTKPCLMPAPNSPLDSTGAQLADEMVAYVIGSLVSEDAS